MPISAAQYKMDRGFEGQLASIDHYQFSKGSLEEVINSTTSIIPFGRFVVAKPGGLPGEIQLPSATGQKLLGLVPFSDIYARTGVGDTVTGFPAKCALSYFYKCVMWVRTETAIAYGSTNLFVRHTANPVPGAFDAIGRIRNNADTARADALLNAKCLDTATAPGELVRLEIDFSAI